MVYLEHLMHVVMVYFGTFSACSDGMYILEHLVHVAMVYFGTFNACGDGIF